MRARWSLPLRNFSPRTEASFFETYFSDTRRLGKGSYGKVFSATYTLDAKRYAVKVFEDVKEDCSNELMQASVLLQQPHPNW